MGVKMELDERFLYYLVLDVISEWFSGEKYVLGWISMVFKYDYNLESKEVNISF